MVTCISTGKSSFHRGLLLLKHLETHGLCSELTLPQHNQKETEQESLQVCLGFNVAFLFLNLCGVLVLSFCFCLILIFLGIVPLSADGLCAPSIAGLAAALLNFLRPRDLASVQHVLGTMGHLR